MTGGLPAHSEPIPLDLPESPYPGLRPFRKAEWPIFFGRETMIEEAVERLIDRQFLVVHGDSGCGKSSLVDAGILARLEHDHAQDGLTWRTCVARPREAPLARLARAIAGIIEPEPPAERVLEVRRILNFGAEAPRALARLLLRGPADHVCIVVDQFEELFAFARRSDGAEEAAQFVQCLVGLAAEAPVPGLYTMLTMRSEFLGACARYPGFAEAVNRTQYLVPRMNRADLLRAIREPAMQYGGRVSASLAERLIDDARGNQDELPLIQHGLLRLYRLKTHGRTGDWSLDASDYPSGGLAKLLSDHADEVAGQADDPPFPIVAAVFRALTDTNADGYAIRHPETLTKLAQIAGVDASVVRRALKPFRSRSVSFVTPYEDEPLDDDMLVDVSHEALIRRWQLLADKKKGWREAEFQDGLIWKSLILQADSFEKDNSKVLSLVVAEERQTWLASHNAAWAERYGGKWSLVSQLIHTSVEVGRKARDREKRRARNQYRLVLTIAVILLAASVAGWFLWRRAEKALATANKASATSLWNQLDFRGSGERLVSELNTLWELRQATPELREAFLGQLAGDTNPDRAYRLGTHPELLRRALAMSWPAPQRAIAATAISDAARAGTTGQQAQALAAAVPAAAPDLAHSQASALLTVILDAIDKTEDSASGRLFDEAVRALVPRLERGAAGPLLQRVIASIAAAERGAPQDSFGRREEDSRPLRTAALELIPAVTAAEATTGLDQVLRAVVESETPYGLEAQAVPAPGPPESLRDRQRLLGDVGAALGRALDESPAYERLLPTLASVRKTTDPNQLKTLGLIAQALASRIAADRRRPLAATLQKELLEVTDEPRHAALTLALTPLAAELPPANRGLIFGRLVLAISGTLRRDVRAAPEWIEAWVALAELLSDQISEPLAWQSCQTLIPEIREFQSFSASAQVGQLTSRLAHRLSPASTASILQLVLNLIANEHADVNRFVLGRVAQTLTQRLTEDQARKSAAAIARTLAAEKVDKSKIPQLGALGVAVEPLSAYLTATQVRSSISNLVTALTVDDYAFQSDLSAESIVALAPRATAETAKEGFEKIIRKLTRTNYQPELEKIAGAGRALARRLGPDDVLSSVAQVLQLMAYTTPAKELLDGLEAAEGSALAAVKKSPQLASKLSPERIRELMKAFREDVAGNASLERQVEALETSYGRFSQRIRQDFGRDTASDVESALETALKPVVELLEKTLTADQSAALGSMLTPLTQNLRSELPAETFKSVLEALGTLEIPETLTALASATATMAPRLPASQKREAEVQLRRLFGWATTTPMAVESARALIAVLPHDPADRYALALVELLSMPTAGGPPTDILLDALRSIPAASPPPADKGLDATLEWAATVFPSVARSMQARIRVQCPIPRWPGAACAQSSR
jgi:hypothetical protein